MCHGSFVHGDADWCVAESQFCGMIELPNGKATTITQALQRFCHDLGIPPAKLVGFGSDGASVMCGHKGGVQKLLSAFFPFMFAIHCIAHRLNLAATGAANEKAIPYIKKKFHMLLNTLFWHFKASAVRTASLASLIDLFDEPDIKVWPSLVW